ncbi:hypothetical protein SAMN02927923_04446 [Microvirga guangxiensis]|uniref:Uncharacterized protein n=1 Tax=Microvirga guangxiensis TaxID=549386 RepID=A0A1G5LKJ2_9HYPH|nr:hypothetical protein SAMN02927923_04446 [Microvirga guangxiensis]
MGLLRSQQWWSGMRYLRHFRHDWPELLLIILISPMNGLALGYSTAVFGPAVSAAIQQCDY